EHVSRGAFRAARVPLRSPYPLRRRVHRRSAPWARRHEDPPAVCPIRGGNPRQRARPRSNRARRTPPSRSEAAQGPRRSSRSVLPDRGWRRKRSCRTETPDRKTASAPTHPREQRAGGSIRRYPCPWQRAPCARPSPPSTRPRSRPARAPALRNVDILVRDRNPGQRLRVALRDTFVRRERLGKAFLGIDGDERVERTVQSRGAIEEELGQLCARDFLLRERGGQLIERGV